MRPAIDCPGFRKVLIFLWGGRCGGDIFPVSSGLVAEITQVNSCRNCCTAIYRPVKGRVEKGELILIREAATQISVKCVAQEALRNQPVCVQRP